MATNITRKEQNEKWFALNKSAFEHDLLEIRPKSFQERNQIYKSAFSLLSYPFQLISVLAGSYLLFSVIQYVWQIDLHTFYGVTAFVLCITLFLGIESLRRWLVNTTGYNYIATFKIQDNHLKKGEWLSSNLCCLFFISTVLVSTGTLGVYQYIKNNSPKANTVDTITVSAPIQHKITEEKKAISRLDKDIQALMQAKKNELGDGKSYAVWKGKEYLLPEVRTRHKNYDKQINAMNTQRQTHQTLVARYENQMAQKEQKVTVENERVIHLNNSHKETYAGVSAGIWLCFELLLVYMLSYYWFYLYGSKKEKLLEEGVEENSHFKKINTKSQHNGRIYTNTPQNHKNNVETPIAQEAVVQNQAVGFHQLDQNGQVISSQKKEYTKPDTITVEKIVVEKEVETEGFVVKCPNCHKTEVRYSKKAIYCSDKCRSEFHNKNRKRGKKTVAVQT